MANRPLRIPAPGSLIRVDPLTDGISYPSLPEFQRVLVENFGYGDVYSYDVVIPEHGTQLMLVHVDGNPNSVTLHVIYEGKLWFSWSTFSDDSFGEYFTVITDVSDSLG